MDNQTQTQIGVLHQMSFCCTHYCERRAKPIAACIFQHASVLTAAVSSGSKWTLAYTTYSPKKTQVDLYPLSTHLTLIHTAAFNSPDERFLWQLLID